MEHNQESVLSESALEKVSYVATKLGVIDVSAVILR